MVEHIINTGTAAQRARQASLVRLVQAGVDETSARRVILFSPDADQGHLEKALAGLTVPVEVHGASDPGAVETDPSALVVCNCVLERQSLKQIPGTIESLARLSSRALLLVRTRYAGEVVDGEDAHRALRNEAAWRQDLDSAYGAVWPLSCGIQGLCLFASWRPSPEFAQTFDAIKTGYKKRRVRQRRLTRVIGAIARLVRPAIRERAALDRLAGKRIALVGNAQSLIDRRYGTMIDAADVVVRCNRAIVVNGVSHGYRTDWLVTGLPLTYDSARARGIELVIWSSRSKRTMRNLPAWPALTGCLLLYADRRIERLRQMIGKVPSTGMKAIDLLLAADCRRLDVYGFDFAQSASASEPTGSMSADHDFIAEAKIVRQWASQDKRLTLHE